MCRRALTGLAAVAAAALTGCGTMLNLDGDTRLYGGVLEDFRIAKERLAQATNPSGSATQGSASASSTTTAAKPSESGTQGISPGWNLTASVLALMDVPLSLVGDTLTLPFAFPTAIEDWDDTSSPDLAADAKGAKTSNAPATGDTPGNSQPVNASTGR